MSKRETTNPAPMKTMIVIPTYNESMNIPTLLDRVFSTLPEVHVVIVDDNSPDGCGEVADKLTSKYPNLWVLHRIHKRGRGSAGIAGFSFALSKKMDFVIEMDADLSHDPVYLPTFVKLAASHAIIIGSRAIKNGRDLDRGLIRNTITAGAALYIRTILGLRTKDVTSGFRGFHARVLEGIDLSSMISNGPVILQEMLFRAKILGYTTKEFPIHFKDREKGESTFNLKIIIESLMMIPVFRLIYERAWKKNLTRKRPKLPLSDSEHINYSY